MMSQCRQSCSTLGRRFFRDGHRSQKGEGSLSTKRQAGLQFQPQEQTISQPSRASLKQHTAQISAFGARLAWRDALLVFERMQTHGPQPDAVCYSAVANACEKGSQWQLALQLFAEMQTMNLRATVIACSAAIGACGRGIQWQVALKLLESMKDSALRGDTISTNTTISTCARGRQWVLSLGLLRRMLRTGPEPDVGLNLPSADQLQCGNQRM